MVFDEPGFDPAIADHALNIDRVRRGRGEKSGKQNCRRKPESRAPLAHDLFSCFAGNNIPVVDLFTLKTAFAAALICSTVTD